MDTFEFVFYLRLKPPNHPNNHLEMNSVPFYSCPCILQCCTSGVQCVQKHCAAVVLCLPNCCTLKEHNAYRIASLLDYFASSSISHLWYINYNITAPPRVLHNISFDVYNLCGTPDLGFFTCQCSNTTCSR